MIFTLLMNIIKQSIAVIDLLKKYIILKRGC